MNSPSDTSIPDNFVDITNISGSMKIFNSNNIELNELTDTPLDLLDTNVLIKKYNSTLNTNYNKIREELFKIYLNEVYAVFEEAQESEDIYNKIKDIYTVYGLDDSDIKLGYDLEDTMNQEYISSSKEYKTSKGRKKAFFFIHDIINKVGMQKLDNDNFIELDEIKPYHYKVRTSLYKEISEEILLPLAHPLGFVHSFVKLLRLTLVDYFNLEVEEVIEDLFMNCYSNEGITQTPLNDSNFGTLMKYSEVKNIEDTRTRYIFDFESKEPFMKGEIEDGLRLVKELDGTINVFDRQIKKNTYTGIRYLRVQEIEISSELGVYDVFIFNGETDAIEMIRFQLYRIQEIEYITVKFKIKDDLEDKWYYSYIPFINNGLLTDSLYEPMHITPDLIFEYADDYDGRFVETYDNCELVYNKSYIYTVLTKDELKIKKIKYISDTWARLSKCNLPENCIVYDGLDDDGQEIKYISDVKEFTDVCYDNVYDGSLLYYTEDSEFAYDKELVYDSTNTYNEYTYIPKETDGVYDGDNIISSSGTEHNIRYNGYNKYTKYDNIIKSEFAYDKEMVYDFTEQNILYDDYKDDIIIYEPEEYYLEYNPLILYNEEHLIYKKFSIDLDDLSICKKGYYFDPKFSIKERYTYCGMNEIIYNDEKQYDEFNYYGKGFYPTYNNNYTLNYNDENLFYDILYTQIEDDSCYEYPKHIYNDILRYNDEDLYYDTMVKVGRIHRFDVGFNKDLNRTEYYFAPSYEEDLALINSSTELEDYKYGNIGNEEYTAREDFSIGIYRDGILVENNNIEMLYKKVYKYE